MFFDLISFLCFLCLCVLLINCFALPLLACYFCFCTSIAWIMWGWEEVPAFKTQMQVSKRKCRFQNTNEDFKRRCRLSNTNADFKTQMQVSKHKCVKPCVNACGTTSSHYPLTPPHCTHKHRKIDDAIRVHVTTFLPFKREVIHTSDHIIRAPATHSPPVWGCGRSLVVGWVDWYLVVIWDH